MIATECTAFKELIATPSLPGLGPEGREGTRSAARLNEELERFVQGNRLTGAREQALRAAALLWHDHLEESHRISQGLSDQTGSVLHGIMHRREPDYSNAKYWFRLAGEHPAYPGIVQELSRRGGSAGTGARVEQLVRDGRWDPMAFVDLCQRYASRPKTDEQYRWLQEVQAIEFDALLAKL